MIENIDKKIQGIYENSNNLYPFLKEVAEKANEGGGITEVEWGDITGTLADQTDLNTALAGKLDTPSTAGTDGQVLTSDGQGGQTWEMIEIDETNIVAESQDSGKVLTAQGNGTTAWVYPNASSFNSGSATSGQVLVANGSGGTTWGNKQDVLDSTSANANVIAPLYVDTGELRLALGNGLHKVDNDLEVEVKSNGGITLDANGISVDTSVIQAKLTAGTGISIANNVISVSLTNANTESF